MLVKEQLNIERMLTRILDEVRQAGTQAHVTQGQLLSASIGAGEAATILSRTQPIVVSILRQLCQNHYVGNTQEGQEAVSMGNRVAESLEKPDGQQHYVLGVECIKTVVANLHRVLQGAAQESELLVREKDTLVQQVNQLQQHLCSFASQKDADVLERQTRQALDSAQADLLSMASNGRITTVESAADTITKYTQMETEWNEAQQALIQLSTSKTECEQQLALVTRELDILQSGDLLFHKERLMWSEELNSVQSEMHTLASEAEHVGEQLRSSMGANLLSDTPATRTAHPNGNRAPVGQPSHFILPEPEISGQMAVDAGAAAKQQHSIESNLWLSTKNILYINLELMKKVIGSLNHCKLSFSEVKKGIRSMMMQFNERHHLHDLEMAAANTIGESTSQEAPADTMHEWLNNIESEFAWLKHRLADHVTVQDSHRTQLPSVNK